MMPRYARSGYTGLLAIAGIGGTDPIRMPFMGEERYRAKMITGPADIAGRNCLVYPRLGDGSVVQPGERLVVRLNKPSRTYDGYGEFLFANSVTGDIPAGFDHTGPGETLLWGVLPDEMSAGALPESDHVPNLHEVNRAFDIGDMGWTFFIGVVSGHGDVECYQLMGRGRYMHLGDDPFKALPNYMRGIEGAVTAQSTPRAMIMDQASLESLKPMDKLLDPEKIGVKYCIRMNPNPAPPRVRLLDAVGAAQQ